MPDLHLPLSDLAARGVNLDQYFGLWAVENARFTALLREMRGADILAHVAASTFDGSEDAAKASAEIVQVDGHPSASAADGYDDASVRDGRETASIAIIRLQGTMTKYGSSMSSAGSTVRVRRALRSAARSEDVDGILLVVDSPGGTVAGTADLAADVAEARSRKPVYVHGEDLVASAAYWVASQADRLYANNPTALVGSIGTFIGLYDLSKAAEQEGIRAVVIKAGDMKGAGFEGTPITKEQIAYWQEIVDRMQEQFTNGVASGRGMAAKDVPVTGKVYSASEALRLGLIDGIATLDETLAALAAAAIARRTGSAGARTAGASATTHEPNRKTMDEKETTTTAEVGAVTSTTTVEAASREAARDAEDHVSAQAQDEVARLRAELDAVRAAQHKGAVAAMKSAYAGRLPGAAVDSLAALAAELSAAQVERLAAIASSLPLLVKAEAVETGADAAASKEREQAVRKM